MFAFRAAIIRRVQRRLAALDGIELRFCAAIGASDFKHKITPFIFFNLRKVTQKTDERQYYKSHLKKRE